MSLASAPETRATVQTVGGADPFRRLACDRCHKQKLRCSRDETGCARCIKAGTECVYSTFTPGGRPYASTRQASGTAAAATPAPPAYAPANTTHLNSLGLSTLQMTQHSSNPDESHNTGESANDDIDDSTLFLSANFRPDRPFDGQTPLLQLKEGGSREHQTGINNLPDDFMDMNGASSANGLAGWDSHNSTTSLFDAYEDWQGGRAACPPASSPLSPVPEILPNGDAITEFIDTLLSLHQKLCQHSSPISANIDWTPCVSNGAFSSYQPIPGSIEYPSHLDSTHNRSNKHSVAILEMDKVFNAANTLHHALTQLAKLQSQANTVSSQPSTSSFSSSTPQGLDSGTLFLLISSYLRITDTFKNLVAELKRCLQAQYSSKDLMNLISLPSMQIGSFMPPESSNMRIALVLQLITHQLDRIDKEASQMIESTRQDRSGSQRASDDAIDLALRVMRDSSAKLQKEAMFVKRKLEDSTSM